MFVQGMEVRIRRPVASSGARRVRMPDHWMLTAGLRRSDVRFGQTRSQMMQWRLRHPAGGPAKTNDVDQAASVDRTIIAATSTTRAFWGRGPIGPAEWGSGYSYDPLMTSAVMVASILFDAGPTGLLRSMRLVPPRSCPSRSRWADDGRGVAIAERRGHRGRGSDVGRCAR